MKPIVRILATCLNPDLIQATTLVFRTLRTGFPNATVKVTGNNLSKDCSEMVIEACESVGASYNSLRSRISHDFWIDRLLQIEPESFWVCDTDMVFWGDVSGFPDSGNAIAGRFEPAFVEPWSGTQKVERLHTSLLWFNPVQIRTLIRQWMAKWHPKGFPFSPNADLVRQCYVPRIGHSPLFYDTCAGLYHAIGGQSFNEEQNQAFEHLHCGVYSDRICAALPGIIGVHQAVFDNVNAAKGLWLEQQKFYQNSG